MVSIEKLHIIDYHVYYSRLSLIEIVNVFTEMATVIKPPFHGTTAHTGTAIRNLYPHIDTQTKNLTIYPCCKECYVI